MIKGIPSSTASLTISILWLFCFFLALAILSRLAFAETIEHSTFTSSLDQLTALYVPYIGGILGYYFATKRRSARRLMSRGPFFAAIVVSVIWNLAVCVPMLSVAFGRLAIEDALKLATESGTKLSWLVAPAIGYFFASPGKEAG